MRRREKKRSFPFMYRKIRGREKDKMFSLRARRLERIGFSFDWRERKKRIKNLF